METKASKSATTPSKVRAKVPGPWRPPIYPTPSSRTCSSPGGLRPTRPIVPDPRLYQPLPPHYDKDYCRLCTVTPTYMLLSSVFLLISNHIVGFFINLRICVEFVLFVSPSSLPPYRHLLTFFVFDCPKAGPNQSSMTN